MMTCVLVCLVKSGDFIEAEKPFGVMALPADWITDAWQRNCHLECFDCGVTRIQKPETN
jgi:hypothetical protein